MPWDVHLHQLCVRASFKVSCLCRSPSPDLTVSSLSSLGCACLPHLPPSLILARDSHKVFIVPWMTLEANSIPNSSLSLWLWLALGSKKNTKQNGFHLLSCKLFCWLKTQDFLWGQKRGVASGQVTSVHSSLRLLLFFSGTVALSQNLCFLQELSAHHDTRLSLRSLTIAEPYSLFSGLTYQGSVLGSMGKITLPEPLLCVQDSDSYAWFHLLFTKSLSDFFFITPSLQTRKSRHREVIYSRSHSYLGINWD